jgi:hypothetical protein
MAVPARSAPFRLVRLQKCLQPNYSCSHREAGHLQSGSAGLDAIERQACGPPSGGCITRSRLPTRANFSVRACCVLPYLSDEDRQKQTHRRQSAKLARHHHPQQGRISRLEAPDREQAEALAIKQFDLDQDQRRRLLIRSGNSRTARAVIPQ